MLLFLLACYDIRKKLLKMLAGFLSTATRFGKVQKSRGGDDPIVSHIQFSHAESDPSLPVPEAASIFSTSSQKTNSA